MASEGVLVAASEAASVLNAANITKYVSVDISGMRFSYRGNEYVIMQREVDYGPGPTSPDGVHIVYRMSGDEIKAEAQAAIEAAGSPLSLLQTTGISDFFSGIKDLAIVGLFVYAGVALLGFFKKK